MTESTPDVRCPACGRPVDPLRAGHVAILGERIEYFCDVECKRALLRGGVTVAPEDQATAQPPPVSVVNVVRNSPGSSSSSLPTERQPILGAASGSLSSTASHPGAPTDSRAVRFGAVLDFAGVLFGGLVPALGFVENANLARLALAGAAWMTLLGRNLRNKGDAADLSRFVTLAPTAAALAFAVRAAATGDVQAPEAANLVGAACAAQIIVGRLLARVQSKVTEQRQHIEKCLNVAVRVVRGSDPVGVQPSEVRPGETLVVCDGEMVGADGIVSGGQATVKPWLDADVEVLRTQGDPVVAGATVLSGRLLLTTTWTGHERAWVRLLSTPKARIDVVAPAVRAFRRAVEWGAGLAGVLVAVVAVAENASPPQVLISLIAGVIAAMSEAAPLLVAFLYAQAHLRALHRGITYRDARSFELAGDADIAVLTAGGAALQGQPEIVAIEPIASSRPSEIVPGESIERQEAHVLALAAGAETGSTDPVGVAIVRTATARALSAEPVRNANTEPGLGVTAIASSGERLIVGGRAIMLAEKIGMAAAEAHVSELEALGRTVRLVALGERLVGLIVLQDGLRPGARPAVQKFLDAGIEPVLLSGESRAASNTLARALDIEHVRPEVLPNDTRAEVMALAEGGSKVCVVGDPIDDAQTLKAADVAVAVDAAGSGDWTVALASADVSRAAEALVIPRLATRRAKMAGALALAPGVVAVFLIAFGLLPIVLAPVAPLLGALVAWLYLGSGRRGGVAREANASRSW